MLIRTSSPLHAPRTLHVTYARMLLSQLQQARPDLLMNLNPDCLRLLDEVDPLARCTLAEWHALMDQVEHLLEMPDLVPQLAEQFKPWHAGLLGFTLMTSGTVVEMAALLQRFHHLLNDVYRVDRGLDGARFYLRLSATSGERSRRLARLSLSVWALRLRWLTGQATLKLDASFEGPAPDDVAPYRRIFGGAVRFDQEQDAMWGDASCVDLPIVSRDTSSHSLLQSQALKQLEQLSRQEDRLVDKVQSLIRSRLDSGELSLEDIAAALKMPSRTLQRRLEEVGANFRLMVDEVRRAQAEHYLSMTTVTLSELAGMLGFADHASFNRAFKRWTGVSPGAFRRASPLPKA
ncbi:MAG: AraC family transcriptional regulator ligand-binding domain-containing protein [Aquabacterium sp.]|uniref:AraC family transcriptional regulator n=1 Tax=Aquabacterium sp. TaxID=1872578 RepID=UPI0025BA7423|nr:AraC family transcriptional regulator [Aquabacterium sp.]MBI5925971.1 AraC family transcriptional regulator ligand-binding domain-containing protein [Aquabacterium sp.]